MPITPLKLDYALNDEQVFEITKAAGLGGLHRIETWQCWDMLRIWRKWIADTFGDLTGLHHRSPPDDPPDIELFFDNLVISMEHTRLQPKHLGQADALMRKWGRGGTIPSISKPPANFAEMRDIIVGVTPGWSSTMDDCVTIFDLLAITLRKKMRGMPNGGIIGIVHDLVVASTNQRILAEVAENIINRDEFSDFNDYTLILLDRWNFRQFHSSLIRRAEPIRAQAQ